MVPFTDGNLEQTRPKLANMELIFPFEEGHSEQKTVPNNQFVNDFQVVPYPDYYSEQKRS